MQFKEKIMKKFIPSVPAALFIGVSFLLFVTIIEYTLPRPNGRMPVYCINNLRQIDYAAREFAWEQNKTNGETINFPNDLTPYIKLTRDGKIPACPQGGTYHISKIGESPTCTLSTLSPAHVLH
jgi:hypothetical protein